MLTDDVREDPDTGVLTGRVYDMTEDNDWRQAHEDAETRASIRKAMLDDIHHACGIMPGEWAPMERPLLEYDEGWRCGNVMLCADRSDTPLLTENPDPRKVMRKNKGLILIVTGTACREIDVRLRAAMDGADRAGVDSMESRFRAGSMKARNWQEWAGEISQCIGYRRCTRLDIAIDVFGEGHEELSPDSVRQALRGQEFTTHLKRGKANGLPGEWIEGIAGNTQYLGGHASLRRACIYDKGQEQREKGREDLPEDMPWYRWEVRLYNEAATCAFADLGACGMEAGEMVRGTLAAMIQFREPIEGSEDRLDRQPLAGWWELFLAGVGKLGYVLVTRAKSLGRQERWLLVGGAAAAIMMQLRVRELRDGLDAAREWHGDLMQAGLARVDESQAQAWAKAGAC
jgi:hypothetical protein